MQRFLRSGLLPATFVLVFVLAACTAASTPAPSQGAATQAVQPVTLNVFAASSLTDAFARIGEQFAAEHAGVEVVFNFAGSNQLATQINEGAPADLFASANEAQMDVAIATGQIAGAPQIFARNLLVVVTPGDNPAGLTALPDLAVPGVKIVLAAETAPAGQYALAFLDKAAADENLGADYRDAVLANVVSYEQSVRSVLTKVALGEADAGIVYRSDAAASAAGEVQQIDIPDPLNTVAAYPIAILSDSPHAALAQAFIEAVLSVEGQQTLEQYGFLGASEE